MARTADTYTAAQAAQVLGISERRVRQLVTQGTLPGERATDGSVRISQRAVNEERKRRSKGSRTAAAAPRKGTTARRSAAETVDVDSLAEAVASAVGQRLEGQLEITRKAESLVRDELDEERARRMQAEQQLQQAQARLAELEAQANRKRGLFRRA